MAIDPIMTPAGAVALTGATMVPVPPLVLPDVNEWLMAAVLEKKVAALEGGSNQGSTATEEWPTYVHPTGAHYISLIDSNSWSPSAYPAGWKREA